MAHNEHMNVIRSSLFNDVLKPSSTQTPCSFEQVKKKKTHYGLGCQELLIHSHKEIYHSLLQSEADESIGYFGYILQHQQMLHLNMKKKKKKLCILICLFFFPFLFQFVRGQVVYLESQFMRRWMRSGK